MPHYELRDIGLAGFHALFPRIKADFPANERPPKIGFTHTIKHGCADCLGFYRDGAQIAYALLLRGDRPGVGMIWFLAVFQEARGKGIGTALLAALHERYAAMDGLILEVERVKDADHPEEIALRERRIRFYRRAGYAPLPRDVQLWGTPYHLMARPLADPNFQERAAREELEIFRGFYGKHAPLKLVAEEK